MPPTPSTPINQDEINAMLWKACDTFRGTVDPSEYKNYILVMLFLKHISDIWQDRLDDLREQFADSPERLQRRLKQERFILPEGTDYYTLTEREAGWPKYKSQERLFAGFFLSRRG